MEDSDGDLWCEGGYIYLGDLQSEAESGLARQRQSWFRLEVLCQNS